MFVPEKWTYLIFSFQLEDKWKRYWWNHGGHEKSHVKIGSQYITAPLGIMSTMWMAN